MHDPLEAGIGHDNRLVTPLASHFAALPNDWREVIEAFVPPDLIAQLCATIDQRREAGAVIYPRHPLRALHLTAFDAVKAVVLGQDPYHGPGQAQGLSFSVPTGLPLPPSLRNICLEIEADIGHHRGRKRITTPDGDLTNWARQGVLLLNTVLTVEADAPQSHATLGWERITDALIHALATNSRPIAFLLWGASAQKKMALINKTEGVFKANHPSPLSARRGPIPFLGCRHFSLSNQWLESQQVAPIDW